MSDSPCDRVLARYRERVGDAWRPADDILFRAAWNEGAYERDHQLRAETEERVDALNRECARAFKTTTELRMLLMAAGDLLVRCNRELLAAGCPLTSDVLNDIARHLTEKAP